MVAGVLQIPFENATTPGPSAEVQFYPIFLAVPGEGAASGRTLRDGRDAAAP
jgi:hypothetical protein